MYSLISAIAKPLGEDTRWLNLDISALTLYQLFSQYEEVVAILSDQYSTPHVSFNISSLLQSHSNSTLTFSEFLTANGSTTLNTSSTLPVISTKYAKYADAFHAGYTLDPINPNVDLSAPCSEESKTHIQLTKENVDYNLFYTSCLVNVNGFYHATEASTKGAYVIDGMKCVRKSNRNECGILSFRELGTLSFIPITSEMIYKQKTTESLKSNCYIDLGVNLSDKSVMLVLGGYLHILDPITLIRVSDSSFKIDFSNLPLIDRYFESKDILDLSSLGLSVDSTNPNHISLAELYGDAALTAYLTLSQSFFVVLSNPNIFLEREFIRPTPAAGVYTGYTPPIHPVVVCAGRHENYWYKLEKPFWSIHVSNSLRGIPVYSRCNIDLVTTVDNAVIPTLPIKNSIAHLLKIGSDDINI